MASNAHAQFLAATQMVPASAASRSIAVIFFLAIAFTAGILFDLVPDMPLGTTYNEGKKASSILSGNQDFHHPLLMLQLVRGANWFARSRDLNETLHLGRTVSAMFGGIFVLSAMLLARRTVGVVGACIVGMLTAAAPLTVVHAHFFKEDIFVAPMLLFSLLTLVRLTEAPSLDRAFAFGVAAGLAASAKYIGVIVIPLAFVVPVVCCRVNTTYFRFLGGSILVAVFVFLVINWNLLVEFSDFRTGLSGQTMHGLRSGYTSCCYVPGWLTRFSWYWRIGLLPGLQPLYAVASGAAVLAVLIQWQQTPPTIRVVFLFTVIWYLLHELSPIKPLGSERHMTVMAGTCAILVVYVVHRLVETVGFPGRPITIVATGFVLALPAAWQSFELARSVPYDTQLVTEAVMGNIEGTAIWPSFSNIVPRHLAQYPLGDINIARLSEMMRFYDFIVINEPLAQVILEANRLGHQSQKVRESADLLSTLWTRPALLIESHTGFFSYRNAPFRVVALTGRAEELANAVAFHGDWPTDDVTLKFIRNEQTSKSANPGHGLLH